MLFRATYYDSRAIIWVWLHGQNTFLYFLFLAYPVCVLLLRLYTISVARYALSPFDSTFSFLLRSLQGPSHLRHFNNTIVPYQQPTKLYFKNTIVLYQLPLRLALRNVAVRLPRNPPVFSDFSQHGYRYSTNTNVFTVQHTNTYIQTYIHTDTNWGSLRLVPITSTSLSRQWHKITPYSA